MEQTPGVIKFESISYKHIRFMMNGLDHRDVGSIIGYHILGTVLDETADPNSFY